MRSMKKIVALLMVAMMLFALVCVASAEEVDYTDAAQRLSTINIMKGDTSGNLMLDAGVTRYQAALFFVQALTGETAVEKWNEDKQSTVFTDVPEYGTAIDYANGIGLIRGRGEGIYGYNDPIIYQDMLVLAVRALGYETADMTYPYGYVIAAEKLGLTENIASDVTNTKALTRGETAQIIWDMLNTQIAAVDPITEKVLYPNEVGAGDVIFGTLENYVPPVRTTLLEKAGFSQAVITSEIVEYVEAKTSKDTAYVVLENGLEIAASDLAITPRTNKSTFLGLPVTLYVDSASVEEFERDYDIVEEDSEATIIFAEFLAFTDVKNVGDEGNIKVTVSSKGEQRITLGENTFAESKNVFDVRVLSDEGWQSTDFEVLYDAFLYEDKEYVGTNSYGEISYAVDTVNEGTEVVTTVYMLYKPYEFGQYFTRTMRYQPLVSDESFITIGKYSESTYKNADNDDTHFHETVLGSDLLFDANITSISKKDGEASREAKISGGSVRSGDFIFYYYNELDNVLVIGQNLGGLKSGDLKSYSSSNETVKIDNTTYTYGFAGAFENDLPVFADHDYADDFMAKISDEANAEYVAINDRIVYLQTPLNPSSYRVKHNYVITTTDPEIMAELLNLEVEDYEKKLTDDGVYVSDKGNMTIAVLNTANGKWGLAEVAQYEYGTFRSSTGMYHNSYDHKNAEWEHKVDLKQHIENYDIFGNLYKGYDEYECARDQLLKGGLFAVRQNASGVYNLCVMFHPNDYGMIDNGVVTDGLYFSDVAPKTNDLKSTRSESKEPARVTLTANSVIVVIDREGNVGVRTGIQGEENSIVFNDVTTSAPGYLYSATAKLIVLQLPIGVSLDYSTKILDNEGNPFDVKEWAGEPAAGADETYYVGLNEAAVEYERLDDGTYELTVSGIFNLRTMRSVAAIKLSVDDLDDTDIEDENLTGKVLYMDKNGKLNISDMDVSEALTKAVNMRSDKDEEYFEITDDAVEFVDDSSISITIGETVLDKKNAVGKINVTVATLDASDIDWDNYDIDSAAYAEAYDDENAWGVGSVQYTNNKNDLYYEYVISDINATESINEPVAGTLDQYIIDTVGEKIIFAAVDGDYYEDAASASVQLVGCGQFDEDDGTVTLYVIKLLVPFAE